VAIFALAKLAESRDPETGAHLERVMNYCRVLAQQLPAMGKFTDEIDAEYVRLLYSTSPLHDIGKVGIPDSVLLKPGRLSDREFEIMKAHTTIGAETLDAALKRYPKTRFLRVARDIAASHHERYDGTGYPLGLKGADIPLCGRIVALADVYDALTSKRVYKEAFAHEVAKGIILKEAGTHFAPEIVEAFLAAEPTFIGIRERFCEAQPLAA
jgi:putative two-component system response regulator